MGWFRATIFQNILGVHKKFRGGLRSMMTNIRTTPGKSHHEGVPIPGKTRNEDKLRLPQFEGRGDSGQSALVLSRHNGVRLGLVTADLGNLEQIPKEVQGLGDPFDLAFNQEAGKTIVGVWGELTQEEAIEVQSTG
ncbi:hypothetical protein DM860_011116 [Cuscuta australis]|uniref:Uncharacterized protein n=1 Tax=Cuscuta australis TaxID=267555 RepID=A0A328DD89_9ASTE|nr:hypothetical protein DM860_011116 [Cuscuta australis]